MKMKRSVRRLGFGLVMGVLLLTVSVLSLSVASSAQIGIGISVRIGPPALPVYAQPICPGPGYFWTPGYWAWNDAGGYYWVPGTWVIAPVGMLWTPGYWGFAGGLYGWHPGYWGRHVGFYGGINYGFGYGGVGFGGGEWRGGAFFYNRSVMNVNVTNVTNVYNRTVIVNNVHTSFNGPGGIEARPTPQEREFEREPHSAALSTQMEHERSASQNRQLFASENHGRPAIAATGRAGEFSGRNLERARAAGEPYREPKMSPQEARGQASDRRGGDRGTETPGRNESAGSGGLNDRNHNERAAARPENREVKNEARNNNNEARNRERTSSRENPKPGKQDKAAQKQAKAEQKRAEKANRTQAKAEQKRAAHEQRR
jgi:hypothetical protein